MRDRGVGPPSWSKGARAHPLTHPPTPPPTPADKLRKTLKPRDLLNRIKEDLKRVGFNIATVRHGNKNNLYYVLVNAEEDDLSRAVKGLPPWQYAQLKLLLARFLETCREEAEGGEDEDGKPLVQGGVILSEEISSLRTKGKAAGEPVPSSAQAWEMGLAALKAGHWITEGGKGKLFLGPRTYAEAGELLRDVPDAPVCPGCDSPCLFGSLATEQEGGKYAADNRLRKYHAFCKPGAVVPPPSQACMDKSFNDGGELMEAAKQELAGGEEEDAGEEGEGEEAAEEAPAEEEEAPSEADSVKQEAAPPPPKKKKK